MSPSDQPNGGQSSGRVHEKSAAIARDSELNPRLPDGTQRRILTGDRTTGKLHLGHYIGSLKNRVKLQGLYDTFILLADVQALTTHYDRPELLRQSVRDVALDYIAVGLVPFTGKDDDGKPVEDDGSKCKFVIQSMVPAIAELTVYYGLIVPFSIVLDNPTTTAEAKSLGIALEAVKFVSGDSRDLEFSDEERDTAYRVLQILLKSHSEIQGASTNIIASILSENNAWLGVSELKILGQHNNDLVDAIEKEASLQRVLVEEIKRDLLSSGLKTLTYGFLGYPISQAADITFVGAHLVPVGEDQVPHIELTRDIVQRFNKLYGETLVLPQALLGGGTVKGLDGNAKMSKSLDNAIYLSDDYPEIWRRVQRAVTDPQRMRRNDPGRPEICNVFSYHELFNAETEPAIAAANLNVPSVEETAHLCRTAGIGCVECKKNLAAKLDAMLDPLRKRRAAWEARPDDLRDVLLAGTRRGVEEGDLTLGKVRRAMQIDYF